MDPSSESDCYNEAFFNDSETLCVLVDADGQPIAGSGSMSRECWRHPPCRSLFQLHAPCPDTDCLIRRAFSGGIPVQETILRTDKESLTLRVIPLSDRQGHARLALLLINPGSRQAPTAAIEAGAAHSFDSLPQTVFETDLQGRITYANRHSLEKFEYSESDLGSGIQIRDVICEPDRKRLQQLFFLAMKSEVAVSAEFRAKTRSGKSFYALVYANALRQGDRITGLRGMLMDISPQKATEQALRDSEQRYQHAAYYDPLTQLPNRVLFMKRLGYSLERAEARRLPLAVLILDLDRFKQINASLGNECGDQVLIRISRRLERLVRRHDTLARLNGDEFALVYADTVEPDSVELLARRLYDAFAEPLHIAEHTVYLTACIGIAAWRRDAVDGETLLRQAAIALHEAKTRPDKYYAVFNQEMQTRRETIFRLEKQIREALQQDRFFLHYQPQIDLGSGRITGIEALARWNGPEGRQIPPDVFIRVAEETGQIHALGAFVLQEACAQNLRWQQQGLPPIRVSVNISAGQFSQRDFVDNVLQTLDDTGLDPQWLELEITESVVMDNIQAAITTMLKLKDMGICFSLDDFGTGHSSLNYLRQLPLAKLKIDRSFIQDIPGNRDNEKLVFSILTLARSFNLQTVAEGIETRDQMEFLQQLECDIIQGYLVSKPVPAEAIPALLRESNG